MPGNPPCRAVAITDCINSAHWILGLSSGHLELVPGWWLLKQHCVLLETKSLCRGRAREKQVAPLCISNRIPALTLHSIYAVSSLCLLHSKGIAQELFTPSDPEPRIPFVKRLKKWFKPMGKWRNTGATEMIHSLEATEPVWERLWLMHADPIHVLGTAQSRFQMSSKTCIPCIAAFLKLCLGWVLNVLHGPYIGPPAKATQSLDSI